MFCHLLLHNTANQGKSFEKRHLIITSKNCLSGLFYHWMNSYQLDGGFIRMIMLLKYTLVPIDLKYRDEHIDMLNIRTCWWWSQAGSWDHLIQSLLPTEVLPMDILAQTVTLNDCQFTMLGTNHISYKTPVANRVFRMLYFILDLNIFLKSVLNCLMYIIKLNSFYLTKITAS